MTDQNPAADHNPIAVLIEKCPACCEWDISGDRRKRRARVYRNLEHVEAVRTAYLAMRDERDTAKQALRVQTARVEAECDFAEAHARCVADDEVHVSTGSVRAALTERSGQ